jgi:hypothetical protein
VLYAVAFGRAAEPIPLPAKSGGASGLYFDLRQQYVILADESTNDRPGWRVDTTAYEYRLLDTQLTELLVYHWQPNSVGGGSQFPHLHVSAELSARTSFAARQSLPLHSRHLPTDRVSLGSIIRFLIAEFGVAYRHRDWMSRLNRTETVFRQEMTPRS